MGRNPYVAAWRLQQRNRRRTSGPWATLATNALPLAVAALLVPFVQPVFLGFLYLPAAQWGDGLEAVSVRAGWLVVAVLAVDVYGAVIRSADRAVLDLLPVDGAEVAEFEMGRVGQERWWLPAALWITLVPLARVAPMAYALVGLLLIGAFSLGLRASVLMHLAAVDVAESPRWAPFLDAVRGNNPRAQAAFLYAPGAILAVAGGLVWLAATGIRLGWSGQPLGFLLVGLPFLAALVAWRRVPALARARWFEATGVLADIDARYAALEGRRPDDTRRAYFDWVVRWLPVRVGRYALKDLRHGWRVRRPWLLGPWLAGAVAAVAGWSGGAWAPGNATGFVVASVWGFAALGAVMDRDDPAFLHVWMPPEPAARGARLLVLVLWTHAVVWLPFFALWLRHGIAAALVLLAVGVGSLLVAVPLATAAGASRAWGPWLYGPVAAIAAAATAAWTVGGRP